MQNVPPNATPESTFLTVAQVSTRMGKSRDVVRILCREGQLQGAFRDPKSGQWRIPTEAVDGWVQLSNNPGATRNQTNEVRESRLQALLSIGPPNWWEHFRHHPLVFYPTAAFIILASIVTVIGVFISSGADYGLFRQQLREWGIPIREFPAASEGETLILVVTFHSTVANTEPHIKIRRAIEAELAKLREQKVRVVVESTELAADQLPQAEALGRRYNASMVIWGEDTGVQIIINFLNLKEPNFIIAGATISESECGQLVNPNAYARFITSGLPHEMTFFALFTIGQSYYLNAQYALAIERIEASVALASTDKLPSLLAAAYQLGWLYEQPPANLNKSIVNYTNAIQLDPNLAGAYKNRGNAYYAQKKLESAIADYTQAIQLQRGDAQAYYNRGVVYGEQNKLDQAIADYTKTIQLQPNFVCAYNNRGHARKAQGKLDEAIADYDRAIQLKPDFTEAYGNQGNAYYAQNKFEEAIADYTKTIQLQPNDAKGYYSRGNVYYAQKKLEAAIIDYDHALALNPDSAFFYHARGLARSAQGKLKEAIVDLRHYLELQPNTGNRAQVEQKIVELEAELAKQK